MCVCVCVSISARARIRICSKLECMYTNIGVKRYRAGVRIRVLGIDYILKLV